VIKLRFLILLISFGSVIFSCRESVDPDSLKVYDGPINSAINILMVQSDSAIIRSEITAPKQLEFLNGNVEFPEGIEIKFFTKDGVLETTMRADRGYFMKNENLYRGDGNVQIQNFLKDQKLQSEEIFWDQPGKKIYTDKFVTIQDPQKIIKGTGMEADDNFANYSIKDIRDSRTIIPGEGI
jgi:LPS export ABC transporter protein LptC